LISFLIYHGNEFARNTLGFIDRLFYNQTFTSISVLVPGYFRTNPKVDSFIVIRLLVFQNKLL